MNREDKQLVCPADPAEVGRSKWRRALHFTTRTEPAKVGARVPDGHYWGQGRGSDTTREGFKTCADSTHGRGGGTPTRIQ